MEKDCPFCSLPEIKERTFLSNDLAFAFLTYIPITVGHTLIAPIRCVKTFGQTTREEVAAVFDLREKVSAVLAKAFAQKEKPPASLARESRRLFRGLKDRELLRRNEFLHKRSVKTRVGTGRQFSGQLGHPDPAWNEHLGKVLAIPNRFPQACRLRGKRFEFDMAVAPIKNANFLFELGHEHTHVVAIFHGAFQQDAKNPDQGQADRRQAHSLGGGPHAREAVKLHGNPPVLKRRGPRPIFLHRQRIPRLPGNQAANRQWLTVGSRCHGMQCPVVVRAIRGTFDGAGALDIAIFAHRHQRRPIHILEMDGENRDFRHVLTPFADKNRRQSPLGGTLSVRR
ncbi:MAG: hypothetical protein COU10_01390 [Candidatus Harrisonbacteria bacterium CG10_big_fil_rev_8_21_14_0_10_45_28]|uniref:HIT domain-containing protein n=1 Tax=Candidatus Harrisonbacteria bacterium CG10_big_fil_rev_8_21_14_0_10_45_28 TaxID=1974586 RepID=A0A2H0UNP7_9BACT|nr:MAG: hypothetical protein COU10_01390 [Candidatus Harrisonbacteria bacterium CG10_big_fil_rev_8_21_14_0_10_45_28]